MNRRDIPTEIIRKTKMNRGDIKFLAKQSISVVRWVDRKLIYVYMMSNFTDRRNMTKITRKSKNGQAIQLCFQ